MLQLFIMTLPLAGPLPKLNDKSPVDVGPAEPGAEIEQIKFSKTLRAMMLR